MLKKKVNLSLNQHLRSIDLSQKYLFKNVNKVPLINKILISIDLKSLKILTNLPEEFSQNYSFFVLYISSLMAPKIFLSKNTLIATSRKNFNLKVILRDKLDIEFFLDNILIYLLENKESIASLKIKQLGENFNVYLPFLESFDLQNFNIKTKNNTKIVLTFNNKEFAQKNLFFKKFNPFWVI